MDQGKTGRFIAAVRRERGYTQRALAEALGLSEKTVSKWECGKGLPEPGYMLPLCQLMGVSVNELLEGERIPLADMIRKMEDNMAALVQQIGHEQLRQRLYKLYGLEAGSIRTARFGAGSLTYLVDCAGESYVVKYPSENSMNHPEAEPALCEFLLGAGVSVCRFLPDLHGRMISADENGRLFHVQRLLPGETLPYHSAPPWLMERSAALLADIHRALLDYPTLPTGIGGEFFRRRTPERTLAGYGNTLRRAEEAGHGEMAEEIRSNMEILRRFPSYEFDTQRLTMVNTHGDYTITQLLCGEGQINAVIDWTTACVHPAVWEVMRSYVYASPLCARGEIDIGDLLDYVRAYLIRFPLTDYDLENMGRLFFYFTAVCDFYGQYLGAMTPNRDIYWQQARLSSGLLRWFEGHNDELTEALRRLGRGR